jgi:hypothetical protein
MAIRFPAMQYTVRDECDDLTDAHLKIDGSGVYYMSDGDGKIWVFEDFLLIP